MFKEHAFSLLCRPYHIYNIQSPHTTLLLTDFYIFFIAISCFSSITDRTLHGEPLLSIAYEFTDSSAALHWVTRNIRSFILLTTTFDILCGGMRQSEYKLFLHYCVRIFLVITIQYNIQLYELWTEYVAKWIILRLVFRILYLQTLF